VGAAQLPVMTGAAGWTGSCSAPSGWRCRRRCSGPACTWGSCPGSRRTTGSRPGVDFVNPFRAEFTGKNKCKSMTFSGILVLHIHYNITIRYICP
jgi:hypothetical protein